MKSIVQMLIWKISTSPRGTNSFDIESNNICTWYEHLNDVIASAWLISVTIDWYGLRSLYRFCPFLDLQPLGPIIIRPLIHFYLFLTKSTRFYRARSFADEFSIGLVHTRWKTLILWCLSCWSLYNTLKPYWYQVSSIVLTIFPLDSMSIENVTSVTWRKTQELILLWG